MNDTIKHLLIGFLSLVGSIIQPALPFLGVLFFAVSFDCLSAYDLSRRLRKQHPEQVTGKFRSEYAMKVVRTMGTMFGLILLAFLIDRYVMPPTIKFYLVSWTTLFCVGVQVWSILENISSGNGAKWAKRLQKIMVDKSARHFDIKLDFTDKEEDKR